MKIKDNAWIEMAGILNITGKFIMTLNICLLMFFIL